MDALAILRHVAHLPPLSVPSGCPGIGQSAPVSAQGTGPLEAGVGLLGVGVLVAGVALARGRRGRAS